MTVLPNRSIGRAYEEELDEKAEGVLPKFAGSPRVGLRNGFGWQLQGFIEDPAGRLRLQTEEEHRWCMGCHGTIGVTVDSTFTLTRKVPGLAGWAYQNPHGIPDVAQTGSETPEYALYLHRVRGGDESAPTGRWWSASSLPTASRPNGWGAPLPAAEVTSPT